MNMRSSKLILRLAAFLLLSSFKAAHALQDCTDDLTYRSKIGLTCSHHREYHCYSMSQLFGLNPDEMSELFEKCSDSCGMCEDLLSFSPSFAPTGMHQSLALFSSGECSDTHSYRDRYGSTCKTYHDVDCYSMATIFKFDPEETRNFFNNCPYSCGMCQNLSSLASSNRNRPSLGSSTISLPSLTFEPSDIPTKNCRDNISFQDKYGSTCEKYVGLDCDKMYQLGFTQFEILQLYKNCMWSCGLCASLPSALPSAVPSTSYSNRPSFEPTFTRSAAPSNVPSLVPTGNPSLFPSTMPSFSPTSKFPSFSPTIYPTNSPTQLPTDRPISNPSNYPSFHSSSTPSKVQSQFPSFGPITTPPTKASKIPSALPSIAPSIPSSLVPSNIFSTPPSVTPSISILLSPPMLSMSPSPLPRIVSISPFELKMSHMDLELSIQMLDKFNTIVDRFFSKALMIEQIKKSSISFHTKVVSQDLTSDGDLTLLIEKTITEHHSALSNLTLTTSMLDIFTKSFFEDNYLSSIFIDKLKEEDPSMFAQLKKLTFVGFHELRVNIKPRTKIKNDELQDSTSSNEQADLLPIFWFMLIIACFVVFFGIYVSIWSNNSRKQMKDFLQEQRESFYREQNSFRESQYR